MTLLQFLTTFQSAIVGLVGFIGVIVTLFVNARISRRRVDEARDHDRDTLVRALVAELKQCQNDAERIVNVLEGQDEWIVLRRIRVPIFESNLSKLGLIQTEKLDLILYAYREMQSLDGGLVGLAADVSRGDSFLVFGGDRRKNLRLLVGDLKAVLDDTVGGLQSETEGGGKRS